MNEPPSTNPTLSHAIATRGCFVGREASGYALLHYPPSLHLAEFVSGKLERFLPLTRTHLRTAFGPEQGDRLWQFVLTKRRYAPSLR